MSAAERHDEDEDVETSRAHGGGGFRVVDDRRGVSSDASEQTRGAARNAPRPKFPALVPFGAASRPEFPVDVLGYSLSTWVREVARGLQVPPDLPAMLALSALSTAAGGRFVVEIRPGWTEPVNTYSAVALEPATRKSAAFALASAPLVAWEAEEQESESLDLRRAADAYEVAEKRVKNAKDRRAKAETADDVRKADADYAAALDRLAETPKPREPVRLLADDVTPEKLSALMAGQGGRFSVLSPEGGLLASLFGTRYSRDGKSSIDLVLKAHAGDPVNVDRVGRESVHLARPALTLGLAIQPEVLRDLGRERSFRGRGLPARFRYSIPRATVGSRAIAAEPVSDAMASAYSDIVRGVLDVKVKRDERGAFVPVRLRFSAEAERAFRAAEAAIEPRLGPDGDLYGIADWAGKLMGATARDAGSLHLADAAAGGREPAAEIGLGIVQAALDLIPYFIAHARVAFAEMSESEDVTIARRVVAWVVRNRKAEFSARDAFRALTGSRATVQEMADLDAPLRLLAERGYVVPVEDERGPVPGRPPSPEFLVNPAAIDADTSGSSDKSDAIGPGDLVSSDLSEHSGTNGRGSESDGGAAS